MKLRAGLTVWFKPQVIGYGYVYGIDEGIPSTVVRWSRNGTVLIEFTAKDVDQTFQRWVAARNMEPRTEQS